MRSIIDIENLPPELKDAIGTYIARLRLGRQITKLAAITMMSVAFSYLLASYAQATSPELLKIIEYIGVASMVMFALSPLLIYVVRRAVFDAFTRLLVLGVGRTEIDFLATTIASGHRAWHTLLPTFWWYPSKTSRGF